MPHQTDPDDPRGLIREAYRIAGISAGECRSIFLDWALGHPLGTPLRPLIERLLVKHADTPSDHPMTLTLIAGLKTPPRAQRRGGRAARRKD